MCFATIDTPAQSSVYTRSWGGVGGVGGGGAEYFHQTRDINLKKSGRVYGDGRTRYLNSSIFFRKLTNGETVKRTWLVYSETSGKVYCSTCKLVSDKENAFTHGFDDWKNVHRTTGHENSNAHRNSVMSSVCLARKNGRIGERFFKELMWLLNSYLNEDLLFVGTMMFMDLTTMETFWGLLSC